MLNKFKYVLYNFLSKISSFEKKEKYIAKADKYSKRIHVSYKKFLKVIEKRKNLDLCEVQKLAQIPPYFKTDELFYFNDFYGINHVLKKYIGYPEDYKFKCVIQHGANFYDVRIDQEFDQNLPAYLTTSEYTKKLYQKYAGENVIYPISTHILYAEDLYDEDRFRAEKKKLGKNLLVFPVHTACWVDISSDTDYLINQILEIKNTHGFDSVTVCVYWMDALKGLDKIFDRPDLGFNVVTAGHMLDPMFLSRLKTIIKLSDMAMTNFVGSCVFYSLSLNKPFYLMYDQTINTDVIYSTDDELYSDDMLNVFNNVAEVQEAYKLFDKVYKELTPEQLAFRDKYCDLKSFKTPDEMRTIIEETEKMYNSGSYKKVAAETEVYI